jgi:hypothetical protein
VQLSKRELQYLRFLATRDPHDLPGWITELTLIRLIRAGAIDYVPITSPSPMRGRWMLTDTGKRLAG